MPVASLLTDGNCASRQRDPDHDDRGEDEPADQPQPGGGDRRQLAARHGRAEAAAAPRQRAIDDLGDHEGRQTRYAPRRSTPWLVSNAAV